MTKVGKVSKLQAFFVEIEAVSDEFCKGVKKLKASSVEIEIRPVQIECKAVYCQPKVRITLYMYKKHCCLSIGLLNSKKQSGRQKVESSQ